jgi:hypothetical protein
VSADILIGILGLVVGLSGWFAFFAQQSQNRDAKSAATRAATRDCLEDLERLVGQWMDHIAALAGSNDSFEIIAAKINAFNDIKGGYHTRMNQLVDSLPETPEFSDIRPRFDDFEEQARNTKDGLISLLADEAHPPRIEDEWERKSIGISRLSAECTEVQELLRDHVKQDRPPPPNRGWRSMARIVRFPHRHQHSGQPGPSAAEMTVPGPDRMQR